MPYRLATIKLQWKVLLLDDDGNPIVKKPVADTSKRDTESVPLDEDVDAYFAREVLPYRPGAWIDKKQDQGRVWEIPFTHTFMNMRNWNRRLILQNALRPVKGTDGEIAGIVWKWWWAKWVRITTYEKTKKIAASNG